MSEEHIAFAVLEFPKCCISAAIETFPRTLRMPTSYNHKSCDNDCCHHQAVKLVLLGPRKGKASESFIASNQAQNIQQYNCAVQDDMQNFGKCNCAVQDDAQNFGKYNCSVQDDVQNFGNSNRAVQDDAQNFGKCNCAVQDDVPDFGKYSCAVQNDVPNFGKCNSAAQDEMDHEIFSNPENNQSSKIGVQIQNEARNFGIFFNRNYVNPSTNGVPHVAPNSGIFSSETHHPSKHSVQNAVPYNGNVSNPTIDFQTPVTSNELAYAPTVLPQGPEKQYFKPESSTMEFHYAATESIIGGHNTTGHSKLTWNYSEQSSKQEKLEWLDNNGNAELIPSAPNIFRDIHRTLGHVPQSARKTSSIDHGFGAGKIDPSACVATYFPVTSDAPKFFFTVPPTVRNGGSMPRSSNERFDVSKRIEIPPMRCTYCRSNREPYEYQTSHNISYNGITTCPVLRSYTCPFCKATGDNAHTIKFCPLKPTAMPHVYRPVYNAFGRLKTLKY